MILDYLPGPHVITKVLTRNSREGENQRKRCGNRSRSWSCYAVGFEGGRRGYEPRNPGGFQKLEKTRKQILP